MRALFLYSWPATLWELNYCSPVAKLEGELSTVEALKELKQELVQERQVSQYKDSVYLPTSGLLEPA